MSQIVIGIDPSLVGTGMCALSRLSGKLLHTCTLNPPDGLRGIRRIDWISRKVNARVTEFSAGEQPALFIEGYAFAGKGRVFDLGELGGVLRLLLARKWNGYYEVPPTSLKKFITGKGNAPKEIMLEQTFRKFGLGSDTLTDNNQVDAFCLAKMGIALLLYLNGEKASKQIADILKKIGNKCTLEKRSE